MMNNPIESIDKVATELITSQKAKTSLIYAFNGSGKTRLSMTVKRILDGNEVTTDQDIPIEQKRVFYFNAFTADLFTWDNDLDNDEVRILNINPDSKFVKYIIEDQGLDRSIINLFQNYLGIFPEGNPQRSYQQIIEPEFEGYTKVRFSKTFTAKNEEGVAERITEPNIKISKGEETNFIWSVFYTFIDEVIENKNVDPESFPNLKYIFIDDPVSSLDDRRIIEIAVDLASLIKKSNFTKPTGEVHDSVGLKFIITTHHPLFFNVLFNELRGDSYSRFILENQSSLTNGDETYYLKETSDSPFAYHLKVIDIIDEAITENRIEKYHYNLLRSLFEKTSTFLGYGTWKSLLPENESTAIYNRYLNLFSHDKQSMEEFSELSESDKEQFKQLYKLFIEKYYFNKSIDHLE